MTFRMIGVDRNDGRVKQFSTPLQLLASYTVSAPISPIPILNVLSDTYHRYLVTVDSLISSVTTPGAFMMAYGIGGVAQTPNYVHARTTINDAGVDGDLATGGLTNAVFLTNNLGSLSGNNVVSGEIWLNRQLDSDGLNMMVARGHFSYMTSTSTLNAAMGAGQRAVLGQDYTDLFFSFSSGDPIEQGIIKVYGCER